VPVIQQAERLSLREIYEKVGSLITRTHRGWLSAEDCADGTFTISDMGVFDIDRATEIILPPQVAILAAGRIIKQVAVGADDRPVLRPTINLTLSVDQRAVNSALAAVFLADLRRVLENPSLLE
jgi:pyruvate dehydrogenase E2 component (dihydrolipoamide acetyltransferase)